MESQRVCVLLLLAACGGTPANPAPVSPAPTKAGAKTVSRVDALTAFARLYGYVRYFHPSDEASAIDWDRFAVYGAGRIEAADSPQQLASTLDELFAPVAPTLQVFTKSPPPARPQPQVAGAKLVAWQHKGYGFGDQTGPYQSVRTHRKREVSSRGLGGFGMVAAKVAAAPLRGKRVRLSAAVRARVDRGGSAALWLRVDRAGGKRGFFDNMADRPIRTSGWKRYQIAGAVAADAKHVVLGGLLLGSGSMELDAVRLEVKTDKGWQPVPLTNAGFEAADLSGWRTGASTYSYATTTDTKTEGKQALRITSGGKATVTGPLFAARPKPGEAVLKPLGAGVSARIPVALYSANGHTLGKPRGSLDELKKRLAAIDPDRLTGADERLRIAGVVVAWNVFQHFYPYFDVVKVDWPAVLRRSLGAALEAKSTDDYVLVLKRLVAALQDGHGGVNHRGLSARRRLVPAFCRIVEGKLVVIRSNTDKLRRGDVITEIDGEPAAKRIERETALISGSPQWKRHRAARAALTGPVNSVAVLAIERGGARLRVHVRRARRTKYPHRRRGAAIRVVRGGVYYVDLDRAPMPAIKKRLAALAKAPGVVFDLRGYPRSNHDVISHLLTKPDTTKGWMQVPRIIYPDRQRIAGWNQHGWGMQPAKPHIAGKVVFLTDGRAISYAESFMGYVARYKLGEILGTPTAGANGNVNSFVVPGGVLITWTGMRVVKHDGSQHHTIGVTPTIVAKPTIAGIRAGRDELLERALRHILHN